MRHLHLEGDALQAGCIERGPGFKLADFVFHKWCEKPKFDLFKVQCLVWLCIGRNVDGANCRPGMDFWRVPVCVIEDLYRFGLGLQIIREGGGRDFIVACIRKLREHYPTLRQSRSCQLEFLYLECDSTQPAWMRPCPLYHPL